MLRFQAEFERDTACGSMKGCGGDDCEQSSYLRSNCMQDDQHPDNMQAGEWQNMYLFRVLSNDFLMVFKDFLVTF